MLPSAVTDADGRYEIRGLGRDRLVGLRIVGPQIAASLERVVTRPMKTVHVHVRNASHTFYGSGFEYVAAPSVPVDGTVKDADSGTPIAGAIIASDRFNGKFDSSDGEGLVSATSDAQGRFKLEGLPLSDKNTLKIVFPQNLPYLAENDLHVPRGQLPQPISRDFELRRCVWAVGRVHDVKTGKPVKGRLFYTPFHSNEFAKRYSRYRTNVRGFLDNVPVGRTDDDGRFRVPVIPGRGVVCFQTLAGDYFPGFGAAAIKELAEYKSKRGEPSPTYDDFTPARFQSIREIDPVAAATQIDIDIPVDSGQNVVLKFVDRSGKRLSGVKADGLRPLFGMSRTNSDTATVPATSPDETRILWFKHEATGLMKFLRFTPQPGETERAITLDPPAVLTGRLVSAEGKPLAERKIDCDYSLGYNSIGQFPQAQTDAQGRFRYELPAGGPFHIASRSRGFASLANDLTVQSGEKIDLGDLVVSSGNTFLATVTAKSPAKRTKSPAAELQGQMQPRP
jgi:hypothetical protein